MSHEFRIYLLLNMKGKYEIVSNPTIDCARPNLEKVLYAKQKLSGHELQQCKLYGIFASNQCLLSKSLLCLASFLCLQAL